MRPRAATKNEIRTERRHPKRGDCGVVGCPGTTTGNKPYCLDHLDELPYVRRLKGEIARRDGEASGAVPADPEGPTAAEILRLLAMLGPMSPGRLSREVELAPKLVEKLVQGLEARGAVAVAIVRTDGGRRRRVVKRTA
jgi:hypothetical protein